MRKHAWLFALALGVGSAVLLGTGAPGPDPAEAARGGTPGPPDSSGEEVPDYGDLIILLRDANGVPIPSDPVPVPDPETGAMVDGGLCWQPIAAGEFSYEGWVVPNPEDRVVFPTESTAVDGHWLIPVDQFTCGVETFFATQTQEVDFGRINEARSPVAVFDSQLEDVVIKLATADSTSLDPAGRMVASTCGTDEATTTSTIDSPLQSLAVYRQLMLTGSIGVPLPQVDDPQLADVLITAARGLGTASDKGGAVNADMVAYLNQAMGLDVAPTILPKLTETYREEVQGEIVTVEKQFLDYRIFGYDRGTNFSGPDGVTGGLPLPAYIPDANGVLTPGTFEYLAAVDDTSTFAIARGPIMTAVFADDPGFTGGNIGGFAQAADDSRAVIEFMHDWPIPDADYYGTPVPCYAQPELTTYDVSISDVSGLQAPRQMVDGSEGREFVVTVANAGPDTASGTVTVTATAFTATPEEVLVGEWTFAFPDLVPGASMSFPQLFTVNLGERTTVDWTALVEAEFDVNPSNNFVTATTTVRVTGTGGGGGGQP